MKRSIVMALMAGISLQADQAVQNLHRYMMGVYYQAGNDLKSAGKWYSLIHPDTNSKYIYMGYIPFLAATQSYSEIVKLIPDLKEQFKENVEIQLLFAAAFEQTGKKKEAYTLLIELNEKHKGNQELTFMVARLYMESGEPENALKVIDNFLNTSARRPNNYIFHFMRAQIFLQLDKKPQALAAVQQCIDAYPKFDKSWLLYAVLHEQAGKLEEAIKGYTTFLEITPQANAEIERHLVGLAFRQKLANKKSAIPTDIESRLLKIQLLMTQAEFDKAALLLEQWINQSDPELWLKTLHLCCYLGMPYKTALKTLQAIEKQKGASSALALYQADLALRDGNQSAALAALQKADGLVKEKSLKLQIALQMGIIYYEQEKWNLAQKTLEQATQLDDSYAPVNNLLAYVYARTKQHYERATQLITQALAKDPRNPHFLDTQAYLLYKQEKYDEALALFKKAAQLAPTDYTALCHLGKCYYKKGNILLARKTIQAAAHIAKNDHDKKKADALLKEWKKA